MISLCNVKLNFQILRDERRVVRNFLNKNGWKVENLAESLLDLLLLSTFCSKVIVRLYFPRLNLNSQIEIEFSIHKDGGSTRVTRGALVIRIIYWKFV